MHINANHDFVMMKHELARVEISVNHAMIMFNVIENWPVEQVSFGHIRPNASQWRMSTHDVNPNMIANQEITAGKNMKLVKKQIVQTRSLLQIFA